MDTCVLCDKTVENMYDEKGWIHLASRNETPMLLEVTNGRLISTESERLGVSVGKAKFRYIFGELVELKLCSKKCLIKYLNLE